jgi:hypothetical protein
MPIDSRIMVDPGIFRELHPAYSRPRIYESSQGSSIDLFDLRGDSEHSGDKVKVTGLDPGEMQDQDLLLCSPTIPGWILSDKTWGETSDDNHLSISDKDYSRIRCPAYPGH